MKLIVLILLCHILYSVQCKKWMDPFGMEKRFKDGFLSKVADVLENTDNHTKCTRDILEWKRALLRADAWAGKMLDSSGKWPSGVLIGNFYSFGEFDQCLSITEDDTAMDFSGKYCRLVYSTKYVVDTVLDMLNPSVGPEVVKRATEFGNEGGIGGGIGVDVPLTFGICIPSSCNINQLGQHLDDALNIEYFNFSGLITRSIDRLCSTRSDYNLNDIEIGATAVFGFFAFLITISTAYDLAANFLFKKKHSLHDLWVAFSIYTNTEKLTKLNRSGNTLRCLNGIRVLSITWVILGHRVGTSVALPTENVLLGLQWSETFSAMAVRGATVAVDTFFALSGLLVAYVFFNHHEKKKCFNPGLFYLHRFIRLWPALAAMMYFYVSLVRVIGSGPLWPEMAYSRIDVCSETWWSVLIYLQNYLHPFSYCAVFAWYLAVDTQLYVLSPILLIPLWKWPKFGKINLLFWILVSQAAIITVVYLNDWSGLDDQSDSYWTQYYIPTHTRAAVWILGFSAGYLLYVTKNKQINISKGIVFICWIISLAIIGAVVFGVYPFSQPSHVISKAHDGTFNAFSRSAWAIAVIWLIFACVHGYGGPINWFLSLRIFEVLGKISYSMYVTHVILQIIASGSLRVPLHFRMLDVVYSYFGDLILVTLVSYVWAMTFESPFLALEKVIFHRPKKQSNKT